MILNINQDLKIKCWKYLANNNMGKRHSANGSKEEQLVGLIGEIMTKELFNIKHEWQSGFDGGFDFIYKGKKIDVKTMGRTVNPKPFYINNFVAFQKEFDCDCYIFNSINKKTNELTICGWVTKQDLLDKAFFCEKGSVVKRSNGTSFTAAYDSYMLENNKLNNINTIL
tara:strand:+ start:1748 stop:2254 length:507 start_codon:yes stop_codon:yes gene_type:complete